MQPRLIDYKLIQKELNPTKSNIIKSYPVKVDPPKKKLLIKHIPKESSSIFTFNFFINIVGLLSIFIGLYILNYRKVHKNRNKEEYEYRVNELAKRVEDIV